MYKTALIFIHFIFGLFILGLLSCIREPYYAYTIENKSNDTVFIEVYNEEDELAENSEIKYRIWARVYIIKTPDRKNSYCHNFYDSLIVIPPYTSVKFMALLDLSSDIIDPDDDMFAYPLWQTYSCIDRIYTEHYEVPSDLWRNRDNWFVFKKNTQNVEYVFTIE